jgi:putative thiamine transport system permease protein
MARTLRLITTPLGAAPLLVLWAFPLAAGIAMPLAAAFDSAAWAALLQHPQLMQGLALSLFTGTASVVMALLCTLIITAGFYRSRLWHVLQPLAAVSLALPHLAFAIGFGFLVMPSGFMARLLVGGEQPPQWVTTQDPFGLSLIAALVLKEIPFLFAMAWGVLSKGDTASSIEGQCRAAASLGHGRGSAWLRIVQPQLLQRMVWPVVIVFVYGATVVDMALVIGPTQPPPFAVVAWQDLNDADAANNARGLAGALVLTVLLGLAALIGFLLARIAGRTMRPSLSAGPSKLKPPVLPAIAIGAVLAALTIMVALLLAMMSVAPRWPYPGLLPADARLTAWRNLADNAAPLWLSLGLAISTAFTAVALVVLWFETQGAGRDRWLLGLAVLALGLPQLVTAAGQYRLFLLADLTGSLPGLFLAHLSPVLAYVAIVLRGPYRNFDERFSKVARALKAGPSRLWWSIEAPLLKGPLLMAAAVGFGVSMVQFVPAQLVAAGRFQTLPMEAVTLSAGGNRALTAVFALALALPPLMAFAFAGLAGRPRWR